MEKWREKGGGGDKQITINHTVGGGVGENVTGVKLTGIIVSLSVVVIT